MPGTENLKIEYVSVNTLTPYENNARSHGKDDVKAIADSIRGFGFVDPIGVWHDIIQRWENFTGGKAEKLNDDENEMEEQDQESM